MNQEIIQEGFLSDLKEKRRKKKEERAQKKQEKVNNYIASFENACGDDVKISDEFRKFLLKSLSISDYETEGVEVILWSYHQINPNAKHIISQIEELKNSKIPQDISGGLYPIGYVKAITSISASEKSGSMEYVDLFSDSSGAVYSILQDTQRRTIKKDASSIISFLRNSYELNVKIDKKSVQEEVVLKTTSSRDDGSFDYETIKCNIDVVFQTNEKGCIRLNTLCDFTESLQERDSDAKRCLSYMNKWLNNKTGATNTDFFKLFTMVEKKYNYAKNPRDIDILLKFAFTFDEDTPVLSVRMIDGKVSEVTTTTKFDLKNEKVKGILGTRDIKTSELPEKKEKEEKELTGKALDPEIQDNVVECVHDVIKNSSSLITALESVAAMYMVPSSHIMCNNAINRINVVNDTIEAPDIKNAAGNTDAIIRSVSALLDNIGRNIDDKINDYHNRVGSENMIKATQRPADPSKGNVVGRVFDADGQEIVIYDTGILDYTSSPATYEKIKELRATGKIPEGEAVKPRPQIGTDFHDYFGEEDDVTAGIDDTGIADAEDNSMSTNDIAANIGESAMMVELYDIYGSSRNLGYELMTEQGFTCLKPSENIVQEASDDSVKGKGSNQMQNIQHMRFDNKKIIEAIKLLNEAAAEQEAEKAQDISFKRLFNTPKCKEAIQCLCDQFNAQIHVRFRSGTKDNWNVYTTIPWDDNANDYEEITVSKTRGFDLGNNDLNIYIIGDIIPVISGSNETDTIGQTIVSILLHEIFHNIVHVWRLVDTSFMATFASSMAVASSIKSAKKRRVMLTNYVNTLDNFFGKKIGFIKKRMLVKNLAMIASICYDTPKINKLRSELKNKRAANNTEGSAVTNDEAIRRDIESTITMYENAIKEYKADLKMTGPIIKGALGVLCLVPILLNSLIEKVDIGGEGIATCVGFSVLLGGDAGLGVMYRQFVKSIHADYDSQRDYEEQCCDLFAAMYQLPVSFKIVTKHMMTLHPNDVKDKERLRKLAAVDIEFGKIILDEHPSSMERNRDAVKCARAMLEAGGKAIDPSIKKYLEWLVDNYSSSTEIDIDEIYNKSVFDPTSADDLDKHLQALIDKAGATVTK